jgi:prolyl-tRNA editing enzyme YbaK/EbsC (Cys-tRNA(Pro) deacylase)
LESTPVTLALDAQNIHYNIFRHPGQVRSLEQAAEERDQRPEQIVRSIVFRLSKDEFVMVLMAGPQQISWSKLRKFLGQSRITMASKRSSLWARVSAILPLYYAEKIC